MPLSRNAWTRDAVEKRFQSMRHSINVLRGTAPVPAPRVHARAWLGKTPDESQRQNRARLLPSNSGGGSHWQQALGLKQQKLHQRADPHAKHKQAGSDQQSQDSDLPRFQPVHACSFRLVLAPSPKPAKHNPMLIGPSREPRKASNRGLKRGFVGVRKPPAKPR